MAVLTETQIRKLAQDRAQINVTTDAPIGSTDLLDFINDAYADIWQIAGGHMVAAKHTDAWSEATTATTGVLTGKLTDIEEILNLFWTVADTTPTEGDAVIDPVDFSRIQYLRDDHGYGTYSRPKVASRIRVPVTVAGAVTTACTWSSATNLVTADVAAQLANVEIGWTCNAQTGIAAGTTVVSKPSSTIVGLLDITANGSGSPTFTAPAGANRIRVDHWPAVASGYIGIQYVPQFTLLAAADTPNVNDLESRDIALLAAARMAPLVGNARLVPSILADLSNRTAAALERKLSAMLEGKQDDANR